MRIRFPNSCGWSVCGLVCGVGLAAFAGSAGSGGFGLDEAVQDYAGPGYGGEIGESSVSDGGYRTGFVLEQSYHDYDERVAASHNQDLLEPREEAEFAVFITAEEWVAGPEEIEGLD